MRKKKQKLCIKENDGLPQIVCMRCLGTLEFLCDFYERCHLTQEELSEASQNEPNEKFQRENDAESDKENAFPSDAKRRTKAPSPESTRTTKNCLSSDPPICKSERKDENDTVHHAEKNDCANELQTSKQSVEDDKIAMNDVVALEKRSKNEQNESSNLKGKNGLMRGKEIVAKRTIRGKRSRNMNDSAKSAEKNGLDVIVKTEQPVRRKGGKKSKLDKLMEASLAKKRKRRTSFDEKNIDDPENPFKRHCLRAICTNTTSNLPNDSVISSKLHVEQKEQTVLNEFRPKGTDSVERNNESKLEELDDSLRRTEECVMKSKAISVIVKQEKTETETASPKQTEKTNQLVWIPNKVLTQQKEVENDQTRSSHASDLEDETGPTENSEGSFLMEHDDTRHSNISSCSDREKENVPVAEQNRVTVIKSSQTNDIVVSGHLRNDKLQITTGMMDESTRDDFDVSDLSQRPSRESSSSGSKGRDKFGKISELISAEQKEAIETYYTIDMSIVNSEEVQKNLTVVDKKNIRCNICGTMYFRMDKCQVHIWGHLRMKPYQCKACDFTTVTVSNVRCHIRKSHLKIKPFACHVCEKRYVTAVLLEEHMNTHTGARPYKCNLCGFASASRQMLNYHNTTHKTVKDVSCKICGKEFYSRGRLRAHMIVHNKDKVIMCKICSAYLSSKEALETHHRNVHTRDYVCNVCGKRAKSRKALHNHLNVHAAAKYKCPRCSNVYKSSQILKEHLLKHEGIRKYKCSVCEKSFAQQSHLAAHMAVHSEIRFPCPGCNKGFNRHDNMKIHTKRCKPFMANPDLKNLLIKKERSTSCSKTELPEDLNCEDMSNSVSGVQDQNEEETSMSTERDTGNTEINFCELGLNISCIEPTDKTWSHSDVYKEGEMTRSTEISVIQIPNVNNGLIAETENRIVLENVLGPESF